MKKNDKVEILRTLEVGVVESTAEFGPAKVVTVNVNGKVKTFTEEEVRLIEERKEEVKKVESNGLLKVKVVNKTRLNLPSYAKPGDAGMDLRADIDKNIIINPLERAIVPTGIFIQLPEGYEAQIRPRSGLAAKNGITVLNTPGTIDSGYRNEIKVILINLSNEPFTIERGERIAQMVINKFETIEWEPVESLDESERGTDGLGSTGRK